jgi:hypothetical protein
MTGSRHASAAPGLGCGSEEVPAAVPVLFFILSDQPLVRLVDQGGGLERLPRRFSLASL